MAFVGQNYGAGKYDRMKESVRVCLKIALVMTVVLSVLLLVFARYCFRIFTDNPLVIHYAIQIVTYFVPFYFLWTLIEVIGQRPPGRRRRPGSHAHQRGWDLWSADPVGAFCGPPLEHPAWNFHLLSHLLVPHRRHSAAAL